MALIPIHSKFQWLFGPRPIRSMICRVRGLAHRVSGSEHTYDYYYVHILLLCLILANTIYNYASS